ncbi:MAG: hypothetical protein AVDCRST_MAG45-2582, partial [uncultured Solirubrobacterales bacterium]
EQPRRRLAARSDGAAAARPLRRRVRVALSQRAPRGRRTRGGSPSGARLCRRAGRARRRGRLAARRPRRALPLLGPHGPAHPARRHRAAARTARPLAGHPPPGHAPVHAHRAGARPPRAPGGGAGRVARAHLPVARTRALRRRASRPRAARARARVILHGRARTLVAADPAGSHAPPPQRSRQPRLHRHGQGRAGGARALPGVVDHGRVLLLRVGTAHLGTVRHRGPERRRGDHDGGAVARARGDLLRAVRAHARRVGARGAPARAPRGRRRRV